MICFFRPYNLVERENVTLAISQKFAQYEDYAYLRVGKGRNFLANFGEMEVFLVNFGDFLAKMNIPRYTEWGYKRI
jgi:hypothetical protein